MIGSVGPSLEYGVALATGVDIEDVSADEANISLIRFGFAIVFCCCLINNLSSEACHHAHRWTMVQSRKE